MGRQVQFYERGEDLDALIEFAGRKGSVVVCSRDSETHGIDSIARTATKVSLVLWNPAVFPTLSRKRVERPDGSVVYQIPLDSPTIELTPSMTVRWQGMDALLMGRIYSFAFAEQPLTFRSWYASLAGWLGRRFRAIEVARLRACIGPTAHEWFCRGGVLLPGFLPPGDSTWRDVVSKQAALRQQRCN